MKSRKSFDSDGVQFAWDSTSLTLASECLRKYQYTLQLNLTSPQTSVHLIFGGAYAKALENFYKYRALGMAKEDALREIVRGALIQTYEYEHLGTLMDTELPEGVVWSYRHGEHVKPRGPVPMTHNAKTRQGLIRSIVWYVDQFGDENEDGPRTYHLADGKPAVELSFAVPFADDLFFTGHLDRVVEYGGGLYWMDQKTTGSALGQYYFDSFKPSNQFMGYTWAGQVVLHSPVKGGIIDAAQIAVGFTRFERAVITFSDSALEEWHDQALYHIRKAQEAAKAHRYPQNFTACGNYGGCPFRALCARSPAVRERFIHGDFVERAEPWDPLVPR